MKLRVQEVDGYWLVINDEHNFKREDIGNLPPDVDVASTSELVWVTRTEEEALEYVANRSPKN